MKRWVLLTLALLAGFSLLGFATLAQIIDRSACQEACYEQKSMCVSECGSHSNPIECEQGCHDQLEDCLKQCR
jgi:hypothetical protein